MQIALWIWMVWLQSSPVASDLAGIGNLLIAIFCVPCAFAIAARAETTFLKVSVIFLLGCEAVERGVIGYLRLGDSGGEFILAVLPYVTPFRYFIALGLVGLFFATMALDRKESEDD